MNSQSQREINALPQSAPQTTAAQPTSPVQRVAGYDMPYPPARIEQHYLPTVDRILDAVDQSLGY